MTAFSRKTAGLVLPAALAFGIAIRAVDFLNCRSLGLDEAKLALNIASRSLLQLLSPLDMDQSAPPLFLWAERVAFLLLGRSDCSLRLLPVAAGTAAVALLYPLARRFLDEAEARLAALLAIFCPLLITYSNAVKQYSVELLVVVCLLLLFERALRSEDRLGKAALAAGLIAPWLSLGCVFVMGTAWLLLVRRAWRGSRTARRSALAAAAAWGLSGAAAYLLVYRAAGVNPYLRRFWALAFVSPGRPGLAWKTVEDQVWGFVAGDPLIDRSQYQWLLHAGSMLVLLLCAIGLRGIFRTKGAAAVWWLAGPILLTLLASMLHLFPVAPRLTLFLLPGVIVLFVAGLSHALRLAGESFAARGLPVASAVLVLPLVVHAVVRTFELEPRGHFQTLVREFQERRLPGEPIYVFARTLPAWTFYSTDWAHPDTARLRFLMAAATSTGPAFENAPSRGTVRQEEERAARPSPAAPGELLGLPSGMEWREVQEHVRPVPDSGWVETERRRIEDAAAPGVWVLATTWYGAERELFARLESDARRRTFAHLRPGSALVCYEFGPLVQK